MNKEKITNKVFRGLSETVGSVITTPFTTFSYIFSKLGERLNTASETVKIGFNSPKKYIKYYTIFSIIFIFLFFTLSLVSLGYMLSNDLNSNQEKKNVIVKVENKSLISKGYGNESYVTQTSVELNLNIASYLFGIAKNLGDKLLVKTPDFTGQTDVKFDWGEEIDVNFIGLYNAMVVAAGILVVIFFVISVLQEVIKLSIGSKANFLEPLIQLFLVYFAFMITPFIISMFITLFNDINKIVLGDNPLFDYQSLIFEKIKKAYEVKDEGWAMNFIKGTGEVFDAVLTLGGSVASNAGAGVLVGLVVLITQLLTLGFVLVVAVTRVQMIFMFIIMPMLYAISMFELTKDVYKNAILAFLRLLCLPLFYIIGFRIVNEFMIKITTGISLESIILYFASILFLFSINMITSAIFGDWSGYVSHQTAETGNKMIRDTAVNMGKGAVMFGTALATSGASAGMSSAGGIGTESQFSSSFFTQNFGGNSKGINSNSSTPNFKNSSQSSGESKQFSQVSQNPTGKWTNYLDKGEQYSIFNSSQNQQKSSTSQNIIEVDFKPVSLKNDNKNN